MRVNNLTAKHMNAFNKASVVPSKRESLLGNVITREAEETLSERFLEALNDIEDNACLDCIGCSNLCVSDEEGD